MKRKIKCIMIVDDSQDDNYYHERVINKSGISGTIIVKTSGQEALDYLKLKKEDPDTHPDLIFLDINMPGMNGWDFLEEYGKLENDMQGKVVITMLTTSENVDDYKRALSYSVVNDFKTKPLTKEMLTYFADKYFDC
jgi:CheY-like chemotaxis protein